MMASPISFPASGMTLEEAREAIDAMRGKKFVNVSTGIAAQLSSSAKGKLISNKATGKSTANGFTRNQHNVLAGNVGTLFETARLVESRPDRLGDANVLSIKRFARDIRFGNQGAVAWMTIKESRQHGHHIYSVEAVKVEALDRIVEVVSGNTPHASSASTGNRIASSPIAVKWGRPVAWIAGSVFVAVGIGKVVCNVHEQFEAIKYREMFWGVVDILCGAFLLYVDHILTERRRKS